MPLLVVENKISDCDIQYYNEEYSVNIKIDGKKVIVNGNSNVCINKVVSLIRKKDFFKSREGVQKFNSNLKSKKDSLSSKIQNYEKNVSFKTSSEVNYSRNNKNITFQM